MQRRAFTLIELLVVIAIIAILAVLVISQISASRIRSYNATAKSDVSQVAHSVEVWKVNNNSDKVTPGGPVDLTSDVALTHVNGTGTDTTCADPSTIAPNEKCGGWDNGFDGGGYPIALVKTPNNSYTYQYTTSTTAPAGLVRPQVKPANNATATNYCVATNVLSPAGVNDTAFYVNNGVSGNSADVTPVIGTGATAGKCS